MEYVSNLLFSVIKKGVSIFNNMDYFVVIVGYKYNLIVIIEENFDIIYRMD